MNIQEREQITRFLQQLTQAQAVQKDSDADALIREACLRQPDAAYLLVQRAMLLDQAVLDSRTRITSLQAELEQARSANNGGSFIDANAWGNSAGTRAAPVQQTPTYPAAPPAPVAAPAASAWGSGMMGNIAMTAAGVVAGGFLFQGIEHLLGNNATHGLNSSPSAEPHENTAGNHLVDDSTTNVGTGNTGVFDTSSVDSFIADDAGSDDIV